MTKARKKNGFIGIEALIAFAILTLILVAAYQAFAGSYRSINRVTERAVVLAEARSLLESIGVTQPIQPGRSSGVFPSGLQWTLVAEEIRPGVSQGDNALRQYWIRMDTMDQAGQQLIRLETIVFAGG